jgi:phosphinothricin acetyltransferase
MPDITIGRMTADSWKDVQRIYSAGIATNNATFETKTPDWKSWDTSHRNDCRLIAKLDNKIAGWAALSNVSDRCAYSGVAEVSIYVDPVYWRLGVGDQLMINLIKESESNGIWTLQAGIFPENAASIKLHEKHGFRVIGVREKIGKMDDAWRDVTLLERRSKVVAID